MVVESLQKIPSQGGSEGEMEKIPRRLGGKEASNG